MKTVEPIIVSSLSEASEADVVDGALAVISAPDASAATGYTTKKSLLSRIKDYIIGKTSISGIGDGTVTGAISTMNGSLANIGTTATAYLASTQSIPDATATALTGCSVTLAAGTWVILGKVTYQGGTAGSYRQARIGTTATGNEYGVVQFEAASNNRSAIVGAIIELTESKTVYLSTQHGDGSATNVAGGRWNTFIQAARIA